MYGRGRIEDFEKITAELYWAFTDKIYKNYAEFTKDFEAYRRACVGSDSSLDMREIVLEEKEINVCYEAWIENEAQILENESIYLEDGEELLEEDREDGLWQVEIVCHLTADMEEGFTLEEIMTKVHNQMANKELGDAHFFEGFTYETHEMQGQGQSVVPAFTLLCGS